MVVASAYRYVKRVLFVGPTRNNFSAAQNDPRPFAAGLREAGHYIMTIAMVLNDEGEEQVKNLAEIASPGFAFSTRDDSVVDDIALALCRGKIQWGNSLCRLNILGS